MSQSIRRRFAFTLGANLFRALLAFATGMLLARWLGPESYGNMAFLLGTFLGIRQLLDMGSSTAFFTFLSQRLRSKWFVRSFFVWLALQFFITICIVGLLFPSQWVETIWQGEQRGLVLLAFAAAFMQHSAWPVIQQVGESQRQTVWVQGIGLAIAMAHLLAVLVLWWSDMLGLYAIFVAIALEYLLAAIVAQKRFLYAPGDEDDSEIIGLKPAFGRYFRYCLPLIPYSWASFAYEFADRWLLQKYGGGVEQAYYAVGAQFSSIALLATTSILRIFWKEIAEAHHRGDHERTGMLYQKVSRLLYLVGAIIAGFFIPWSEDLLRVILGVAYAGGATTLAIMFLFPVHQSMGQIGGTMLFATERVSIQVVIGIFFMIASIGASYLVLAPGDAIIPGLGLASEGLALKMVAMQIISVNVIAFIIARIWGWAFDWGYQLVSLLGCILLGWVVKSVVFNMVGSSGFELALAMSFAGLLYLLFVALFIYMLPWISGLTRIELVDHSCKAWRGALRLCRF